MLEGLAIAPIESEDTEALYILYILSLSLTKYMYIVLDFTTLLI